MTHPDKTDGQYPGAKSKDPLVPGFRELPPVDYWAGSVSIPSERTQELLRILSLTSQEKDFTFTGFLTRSDGLTTYTFTRYPRHARGIASIEDCEDALLALHLSGIGPAASTQFIENQEFRVLLGLREGYEKDSKVHPVEEIEAALPETNIKPAEIYVVGPTRHYQEPAVIITGTSDKLPGVYNLAESLHQERFTVEDLQNRLSYVVEPPSCTTPDPEPIQ
jgi:hypothetical protein